MEESQAEKERREKIIAQDWIENNGVALMVIETDLDAMFRKWNEYHIPSDVAYAALGNIIPQVRESLLACMTNEEKENIQKLEQTIYRTVAENSEKRKQMAEDMENKMRAMLGMFMPPPCFEPKEE